MRTLFALSLAALSLTASTASAAPKKAQTCPAVLPFALPSETLSAEWGDHEWQMWSDSAVMAFCAGRESTHACQCARRFVESF